MIVAEGTVAPPLAVPRRAMLGTPTASRKAVAAQIGLAGAVPRAMATRWRHQRHRKQESALLQPKEPRRLTHRHHCRCCLGSQGEGRVATRQGRAMLAPRTVAAAHTTLALAGLVPGTMKRGGCCGHSTLGMFVSNQRANGAQCLW